MPRLASKLRSWSAGALGRQRAHRFERQDRLIVELATSLSDDAARIATGSRRAVPAPAPRLNASARSARSLSSCLVPRGDEPTPGPGASPTATPGPPPRGRRARRTRSARRAHSSSTRPTIKCSRSTAGTAASQTPSCPKRSNRSAARVLAATLVATSPRRSAGAQLDDGRRGWAPPRRPASCHGAAPAGSAATSTPRVHGMQSRVEDHEPPAARRRRRPCPPRSPARNAPPWSRWLPSWALR